MLLNPAILVSGKISLEACPPFLNSCCKQSKRQCLPSVAQGSARGKVLNREMKDNENRNSFEGRPSGLSARKEVKAEALEKEGEGNSIKRFRGLQLDEFFFLF
jgi:hypothetical protein